MARPLQPRRRHRPARSPPRHRFNRLPRIHVLRPLARPRGPGRKVLALCCCDAARARDCTFHADGDGEHEWCTAWAGGGFGAAGGEEEGGVGGAASEVEGVELCEGGDGGVGCGLHGWGGCVVLMG